MDVQMLEMGGLDGSSASRRREKIPCKLLPVIALAEHATQGDGERCQQAGIDAYLTRPVNPVKLFAILEKTLVYIHQSDKSLD
jgi:CheY-like chemotaxis protein